MRVGPAKILYSWNPLLPWPPVPKVEANGVVKDSRNIPSPIHRLNFVQFLCDTEAGRARPRLAKKIEWLRVGLASACQ